MKKIFLLLFTLWISHTTQAQYTDYEGADFNQSETKFWSEVRGGLAYSLKSIQFVSASYAIFMPVNDIKMFSIKLAMQQGVSGEDAGAYNNLMLGMMFTRVWGETHRLQVSGGLGFAFVSEPIKTSLGRIEEPSQTLFIPLELSFFPKQSWTRKTGVIANYEFSPSTSYLGLGLVIQLHKKESDDDE